MLCPVSTAADRDVVVVHSIFTVVAVVAVLAPVGPLGVRLTVLVLLYAALLLGGAFTRRPEWKPLLRFVMPLSAFQVLPDWFLSQELEVLTFPDTGGLRLGTVPAFMAGLWTIPFFISIWAAESFARRRAIPLDELRRPALVCLAVGLALFLGSEATLWALPIWSAHGVAMTAKVAHYVVLPEALLAWAAFVGWRLTRERPGIVAVGTALLVSLLYTGALSVSFLLFERVGLR